MENPRGPIDHPEVLEERWARPFGLAQDEIAARGQAPEDEVQYELLDGRLQVDEDVPTADQVKI